MPVSDFRTFKMALCAIGFKEVEAHKHLHLGIDEKEFYIVRDVSNRQTLIRLGKTGYAFAFNEEDGKFVSHRSVV